MRVFRLLKDNRVEQASFDGRYNSDVWKPLELLDTYTEERTGVDEEGVECTYTVTLYPEFVSEQEGRYIPDMVKIQAEAQAKAYEEWKASRAKAVANIKVTVNGKVFDGDEVSQTRMARTIAVLGDTEEQPWVLADNTPTLTTKAELVEALRLAGIEQTRLWIYEGEA